jgi:O-antigen/teichoic acid export membrane protein
MKKSLTLSVLDQGLLSVFSFAVGLLLIRQWSAAPELFGLYSIIFAMSFVASSAQNALIAAHLSVMRPAVKNRAEEGLLLKSFWLANLALIAVSVLLTGVSAAIAWGRSDPMLAIAAAGYIGGVLLREYVRVYYFSEMNVGRVILADAVFVLASAVGLCIYWLVSGGDLRVSTLYFLFAAASALGALPAIISRWHDFGLPLNRDVRRAYIRIWREQARWALLGAVTTEIQNRGYIFVVGAFFGTAAVGMLQAANLVFRPLGLLVQSWGRIARPLLATRLAAGAVRSAQSFAHLSAVCFVVLTVLFTFAVAAAWPLLERHIFRGAYSEIKPLVILWGIATAVTMLPAVYSMQAQGLGKFRELSGASILGALTSAAALAVVVLAGDFAWSVSAIILGQLASLGLILAILWRALGWAMVPAGWAGARVVKPSAPLAAGTELARPRSGVAAPVESL